MVDKVRAIVGERNGAELEFVEETNPSSDFISSAGLSFGGSDDFLLEKLGNYICPKTPDYSSKPTYSGDVLTSMDFFEGATQTTPNRRAKAALTYSGDDLSTEVWEIYDPGDGTTVLKTITTTYTYSGGNFTKAVTVQV